MPTLVQRHPTDSKVDLLYYDLGGGQVSILKVLYLPRPVTFQAANSMCSGDAFVPVFRAGPWNIKKGIQYLLPRLGGYQVRWHTLEEKQAMSSTTSKDKWNPPNIELEEGVAFINSHAPECDARNEQTLWILINIKTDSGTPIAGWPEAKVRNMAQNKSKGLAETEGIPLSTDDIQPETISVRLPAALSLPVTPQLWRDATRLSWCWQDSICDHHGHGTGEIPCSQKWLRRAAGRMATCKVIGQLSTSCASCA